MLKAFWEKYKKDKRFWAACAAFAVLVALCAALLFSENGSVKVTASGAGAEDVLPNASFYIKLGAKTTPEALRARLTLEPAVSYELIENTPNSYELKPFQFLEAGSDFSISVVGAKEKFSFKVQNVLQIRSVFPADNGRKTPVDVGVEVEFNARNILLESFEKAFSIEPRVEGEFTSGDGRFVFYPTEGFLPNTKYTVTIAQPLESESGALLTESRQFSFVTSSLEEEKAQMMFQLSGNGVSANTLTSETPLVQVYLDAEIPETEQEVSVELFSFADWQEYRAQLEQSTQQTRYKNSAGAVINTEGLSPYASFALQPIALGGGEDYYNAGAKLLQFPEPLPEGWYAAEFTINTGGSSITRQMFLQVSDLSVFYMLNGKNLLAWVNDAATGEPVQNARFEISGAYHAAGTTGVDGTANINTGAFTLQNGGWREDGAMLTATAGGRAFVDASYIYNYGSEGDEEIEPRKYAAYLFTDREIYHTTDTVHVWGTVRPRSDKTERPKTVRLGLEGGAAAKEVAVGPNGTFTTEIAIENMVQNSWTDLRLMLGETVIKSTYLRLEDFVKPIYTAETSAEKVIYSAYDDNYVAKINFDASLYDGTPASSLAVSLEDDSGDLTFPKSSFATDENGHISAEVHLPSGPNTWRAQSYSYRFATTGPESENFQRRGSLYAVHRDIMLEAGNERDSGGTAVKLATNKVTLARVKNSSDLWKKDALKGLPVSKEITAEVHRVYYTKQSKGWHYDFISRTAVESFRYDRHDDVTETRKITTGADGTATLSGLPKSDEESCYYVVLRTKDSNENTVEERVHLGMLYERGGQEDSFHRYQLEKQVDEIDLNEIEDERDWLYYAARRKFKDNEAVTFVLKNNDELVSQMTGRILYSVVQDDFAGIAVSDKPNFTLPYSEALLPNYVITGAYFDGKHIYALEDSYMSYNPEQRELEIELKPDKTSYRPADTMSVSAAVKNKQSGQPAKNAEVVLSVVDEAVFAIEEQVPNLLNQLYESVYYPYLQKYTSYIQTSFGGPGEKGGGGGDEPRSDFKDTAWFETAVTDENGRAYFTVKLPDNITDWRLTSLALTPDGQAGDTKTNVKATQEFFVMPIVSSQILAGDTFAVGLRSAGVAIDDGDEVRYKVNVRGGGVNETDEILSAAKEYEALLFEALEPGEYTVTVTGECGSFKDAVALPFSVVESGIEVSLVKTLPLSESTGVTPLRYPVSMTVYDKPHQLYSRVLSSLLRASDGVRTDMRMARAYAARLYEEQNERWYDEEALEENFADVRQGGVLKQFPYDTPDIELTAKAYLAAPKLFPKENLVSLDRTADNSWINGAKTAFILTDAIAGKPLPSNIATMLDTDPALDYADKMYLATALAVSGDTAGARAYYDKLVKPRLTVITGISGEEAYSVKPEDDKRSEGDCTAAASMLASVLRTDEAGGLARYLVDIKSQYEPYLLEQMIYLTYFQPEKGSGAKFSYTLDGKTLTEELSKGVRYLTLNKEQLAAADFKVLSGDIWADVVYMGAPEQLAGEDKKLIGLTKTVEAVGGSFERGALVKITLTPDLSALSKDIGSTLLVVDDYIPSGMRFESYNYAAGHSRDWYLESRQEQRLKFYVYGDDIGLLHPIVYYARCATPGSYVVESAYINSANGDIWGGSKRSAVNIT